ncbi:hypothetical protein R1sor_013362 [Riccia sorocarpa]|uniref:Uncharacterized protein n=1 Tax=Riccia sorocarpa TaxID=122646 RepID=A0ABD3H6Y1_9MARC
MGNTESQRQTSEDHSCESCKPRTSVYPIYGAFWGMGIGLGCGVGWGPGLGPNIVGYVGSGCGLGVTVGVTLIGIGVGFPTTGFTRLPYRFFLRASKEIRQNATRHFLSNLIDSAHTCWNKVIFHTLAVRTDLQHLVKKTTEENLRDSKTSCNSLRQTILRFVENFNRTKYFPTRNISYRLQMKEVTSLREVPGDTPLEGRDKWLNHDQVRLEYEVNLRDCCGQVVRFSRTSKHFVKCSVRRDRACSSGPPIRLPRITPCRRQVNRMNHQNPPNVKMEGSYPV